MRAGERFLKIFPAAKNFAARLCPRRQQYAGTTRRRVAGNFLSGTGMTALAVDWSAVLPQHERWLRTVVAARVPEPDGIDEVWQEVSLAAIRQAAPVLDAAKLAPWLYRLAVRQSLLYRRRRGRQRKLATRFAETSIPRESAEPLMWLVARERQSLVRGALERLAPCDAQILLLKYVENWNYHQMARHLGVSHSAIEARLHRARRRMRAMLETQVLETQVIETVSEASL